jgi:hypothetical protein
MKTNTVSICGINVEVDHIAMLEIMISLSDLHGRMTNMIGACGDMKISTELGSKLVNINSVHENLSVIEVGLCQRSST